MSARASSGGFTLLEVLVAVFIMALVLTFSFQAYQGIAEAYTRVTENSTRDRAARVLLDRIERELVGAVLVEREEGADPLLHPYLFYGRPITQSDSEGFELRFVTQTPLRSPGSPPATLMLVTYGSVPSPTGHGLELLRQEEALPAQLEKEIAWNEPQVVADDIAIFTMSFTGEAVEVPESAVELPEGWDSTSVEQLDALPLSVELKLALWEMGPDGQPWPGLEATRTVELPVRPFKLEPEDDDAPAQVDCGTGLSAVACVERYGAELDAASTSLGAAIREAVAQASGECWSAPEPSPALQRVKVLMSGLPGFNERDCP